MFDGTCSVAIAARSTSDFDGVAVPETMLQPLGSCCLLPLENIVSVAPTPSGTATLGASVVFQSVCGATAARFPSPPSKQLGSTVTALATHEGPTTASARATTTRHAATRQATRTTIRPTLGRRSAETRPAVMRGPFPVLGMR